MHDRTDMMPRSLAITLLLGSLAGSTFWASLITLMVR